jgi:hypothetical protein
MLWEDQRQAKDWRREEKRECEQETKKEIIWWL